MHDWRMTRLTFGVKSSPYLATQVLRQLARDYREEFPRAASIVESCFYVDDCLTGAETIEDAVAIREELNALFSKACMKLRKWRSNFIELLQTIPEELQETSDLSIATSLGDYNKALGLHWNTTDDNLHIATPDVNLTEPATKRRISSVIAQTFDVLGWFTPATLPAKTLLQRVWALKTGWDTEVPKPLQEEWLEWLRELPSITKHPIPRHFGLENGIIMSQQLHGFADASKLAYGGVVYLRTFYVSTEVTVDLVASKVKVAPRKPMTIPRLELCAALTLSNLIRSVADDLKIADDSIYAWSDSSAVLGWQNKSPSLLKVFVANRVIKISSLFSSSQWRYVQTNCNPSDLLSRGMAPSALLTSQLWWKGPPWLMEDPRCWPRRPDINLDRELPEMKATVLSVNPMPEEIGPNVSFFQRLVRIRAWMWRLYYRLKGKPKSDYSSFLSVDELRSSRARLLIQSQRNSFWTERQLLEKQTPLPKRNSLASLAPYIDSEGYMRVGGRLQRSSLSSAEAQPIILSPHSPITKLLIEESHRYLMHAGPSTMMATLAHTYYIPRLKPLLRKMSRSCVYCQKAYARTAKQMMGDLPDVRTRPARAFSIIGMDFAGPILTKRGNPRRPQLIKTYVCLFVCFTTRAVHLEVVSDLSTAAFMAAFRRFTARRGCPARVFTDNGSNFLGAQAELKDLTTLLRSEQSKEIISQWAAKRDI